MFINDLYNNKKQGLAEEQNAPVVHRIGLTVTDPNHPMVSKRREQYQKSVRVTSADREKAIASAIAHARRKGYKVHDHHYLGTVDQGVAEGLQEINWIKPNFDFEWHEVEEQSRMKQVPVDVRRYYQKHFPNKDAWLKAVQNGKAVVVPPDHNYEIRNAPFDKASLQKVLAPTGHEGPIGPAKEKRVNDLFDKGQVEMPIILKTSQGLWLIGGKTRLGTANYVKGLPAKVWLIDDKQGVAEGMADDLAAIAQKKFPNALIRKNGEEVQKPKDGGRPYTPPAQDAEKVRRDLTAKYPNIDELVRQAELRRDPTYDYAEGEAYYRGREAEQNYRRLRQIQRVIQGLNESRNPTHLP
jgi:hypothetical protein